MVRLRFYADKDSTRERVGEPLATIWDSAPQLVKSELRKLRLDRGVRSHLQKFYGIAL